MVQGSTMGSSPSPLAEPKRATARVRPSAFHEHSVMLENRQNIERETGRDNLRTLLIFAVLMFMATSVGQCESWEEFQKAKVEAETPDLTPKAKPDVVPKRIIVERIKKRGEIDFSSDTILFDYGSWKLREASSKQLKEIAAAISDPSLKEIPFFYVDGHTCNIGTNDNNCILSSRRANSVVRYLVQEGGLARNKVVARGFGIHHPVASNDNEEGRRKNRRVVLKSGAGETKKDEGKICP
jgi:outer membrane protein OmpA-like peptidoglycan-associated protein